MHPSPPFPAHHTPPSCTDLCDKDGFFQWSSVCVRFLQQAATPVEQWQWRLVGCAGVTTYDTFNLDLRTRGEQPLVAFSEGTISIARTSVLAWQ